MPQATTKKLPAPRMDRVRAARAYLNQAGSRNPNRQADMELHAFMALFHPEVSTDKVREMSRDMRAHK